MLDIDKDPYALIADVLRDTPKLRILELGTRRVEGSPSTVRRHLVHARSEYTTSDFMAGDDVDVVADAHALTNVFPQGMFDAVWSCSLFEHLARPWLAMQSIAAVTQPGGWVFTQTHQTFPIHGYPNDYFRFSREALELLCTDAGLEVIGSAYNFPARITCDGKEMHESIVCGFLNVVCLAQKPGRDSKLARLRDAPTFPRARRMASALCQFFAPPPSASGGSGPQLR